MKRGEIFNLKWEQIDFLRRTIKVERTKSGKPRVIPINEALFSVLGDLKKKSSKSDYVFLNSETGNLFKM
jgi:integrase